MGVRDHIRKKKPRAPRTKDDPGIRVNRADYRYKAPPDPTKRVWMEVYEGDELVAEGTLKEGWAEAYRLLQNPELKVIETNYNNYDLKYFYTWLVQSDREQYWVLHFNRKDTTDCCYNDHKGYITFR